MGDAEFCDGEGERGHQLLMHVNCVARKFYVEERSVGGEFALVFVFVAVGGNQIRAIDGAVDRDFAFFSAADGADFFALGRAEPLGFAFFADGAGHDFVFSMR
jgi:hypothetical protein